MLEIFYKLKNDNELMLLLQHDKKIALKILFERHYQKILNYLYWLSGQKELAEDLCQEVFFKVYRNRSQFDKKYKFKSWIFRISKNLFIDSKRKKKEILFEEGALDQIADDNDQMSCGLEIFLEQKWKKEKIVSLISSLPLEQKEALVLWIRGESYNEIAVIIQKSEQACKNLVNRAKNNLLKYSLKNSKENSYDKEEEEDVKKNKTTTFKKALS